MTHILPNDRIMFRVIESADASASSAARNEQENEIELGDDTANITE